jgi:small-conductance mechanosensitive channel
VAPVELTTIGITLVMTIAAVLVLRFSAEINGRSESLSARRRAGVLQLAKWAAGIVGTGAVAAEVMMMLGASPATMALIAAAATTGLAFALREPVADFLAAATFLIERAAAIGDEVELNEELRGRLVGFGLRTVAVKTWDGDSVLFSASAIRSFRNISAGASRATVDIDIPARVRTRRAQVVLESALSRVAGENFLSRPEVLGVVSQHLDHYVMRVTCMVEPAQHKAVEYALKAAAVDAVSDMVDNNTVATDELVELVVDPERDDGTATPPTP